MLLICILEGGPILKERYDFNLPPELILANADDVACAPEVPPKAPTKEPKNPE